MSIKAAVVIPLLFGILSGCCCRSQIPPVNSCIGSTVRVEGLKSPDHPDDELLRVAIGLPRAGRLCAGEVFVVEKPVAVYRVWDKSRKYTMTGRWWTFEKPQGPLEEWQAKYEVCREFGTHDRVTRCLLKAGTRIVVGPGQSMRCADGTYGRSAANQVYVPNALVNDDTYVEQCEESAWP